MAVLKIRRNNSRRRVDKARPSHAADRLGRLPLTLDSAGDALFHTLGYLLGIFDQLLLVGDLTLQIRKISFDPRLIRLRFCAWKIALGVA
jgi:hypothetical protein